VKTTKKQRKAKHREYTEHGVPRSLNGNRLGLRKRRELFNGRFDEDRREVDRAFRGHWS